MDDEWDTDPDFQAKDDSNGDGSGTVAVSNPFLKPVETVTQDPYGRPCGIRCTPREGCRASPTSLIGRENRQACQLV